MSIPNPDNVIESWIAIVLTDIIGSTQFVRRNGDRKAMRWFQTHDRLVISLLTKHNGVLCDASDGHLMYFPTVGDAIAFSCAYKEKLRTQKYPFRSRVGIHWAKMLIVGTPERLVRANHKRIALEGIGKNVAARTMSICGSEQILLSKPAYSKFKERTNVSRYLPKGALFALVGLYKFKGVFEPEEIFALGFEESHLQPPPSGEKVKRLGGAKKIRVRLRDKKLKEIAIWAYWRLGFLALLLWVYILWPILIDPMKKRLWGFDYWFFKPFDYIPYLQQIIIQMLGS